MKRRKSYCEYDQWFTFFPVYKMIDRKLLQDLVKFIKNARNSISVYYWFHSKWLGRVSRGIPFNIERNDRDRCEKEFINENFSFLSKNFYSKRYKVSFIMIIVVVIVVVVTIIADKMATGFVDIIRRIGITHRLDFRPLTRTNQFR